MPHMIITGRSGCGKSSASKILVRQAKAKGIKTSVLDPIGDQWEADFQTTNPEAFLAHAQSSYKRLLIVDEGGIAIGRYAKEMQWIVTTSRHHGHQGIIITQALTQLDTTVRGQCASLMLFDTHRKNIDRAVEEWNCEAIRDHVPLKKFEFLWLHDFDKMEKGRVDIQKQSIYYERVSEQHDEIEKARDDSETLENQRISDSDDASDDSVE